MNAEILLSVSAFLAVALAEPLVRLPNGQILGSEKTTLAGKKFYSFEGIPYAAPPVGPLRFLAPQPALNWEGVLDATSHDTYCFQTNSNTDFETEDCLHLNVFTPMLPDEINNNVSLPVVVVLYGGGFINGHASKDADLFIDNDVIMVTIDYRIGIFGFLSTVDDIIPGNAGLKDQAMSFRWVNANIHLFGGDPNRVTISGQSAGSAAIGYHLFNLKNEGLFQAVIMQSGSALSPWSYQREARDIAFKTGTLMHAQFETDQDPQALLDFMQNATARDIDWVAERYMIVQNLPLDLVFFQGFTYAPVIEVESPEAVITEKMYGLLEVGNVLKVPILMGVNTEESISLIPGAEILEIGMLIFDDYMEWLVPHDMQITDPANLTIMGAAIKQIYTGGAPLAENLGAAVRYCSDNALARSILKYAEMVAKSTTTYFYQFAYNGQMGRHDVYYEGAESVGHGEENYYMYCRGDGCDGSNYPQEDQLTRDRLIKLWTNFIKYQNPTPEPLELLDNVTWPLLGSSEGNMFYLNINETLEIGNHPKQEMYSGWQALYDSLGPIELDTY